MEGLERMTEDYVGLTEVNANTNNVRSGEIRREVLKRSKYRI